MQMSRLLADAPIRAVFGYFI